MRRSPLFRGARVNSGALQKKQVPKETASKRYDLSFPAITARIYSAAASVLLFAVSIMWVGCQDQPTEAEDYEPQAVVQAYLVNGQPVDRLYLQWVAPLYGYYDRNDYGIADAEVIIYPTEAAGDTLHFVQHEDSDSSWIYLPAPGEELIVQGKTRYRIEAKKPSEGINLWSEAVVPDTFTCQIVPPPLPDTPDTLGVMDREDANLYLTWSGSDSAGGYNLNVTCLTPEDELMPLDPEFNPEVDTLDMTEVNLSSFWPMRDDQREMLVPWFMFAYVGWHRVDVQAITKDYYDYGMSIFRFEQGLPIQLESNIQGGLGIFAAMSNISYYVYMVRVEQ